MREFDPSMLTANPVLSNAETSNSNEAQPGPDDEKAQDIANDPFAAHFTSASDPSIPPKVLITTSPQVGKATYEFCDELVGVFPGAEFVRRKNGKEFELSRIAGWAAGRGYGSMVVVNEDHKRPSERVIIGATRRIDGLYVQMLLLWSIYRVDQLPTSSLRLLNSRSKSLCVVFSCGY